MKTVLRSLFFIVLAGLAVAKTKAQCTVSNIIIQTVSVASVQGPGTCTVTFNASFTIENNNGNKYIFIHAWQQQSYPNYFHCENGQSTINGAIHAPKMDDLANAFLTIGIDNSDSIPVLLTSYTPDPSVPVSSVVSISREVLPDGSALFILRGITVTLPSACNVPGVIIADLWSSQAAAAQVAHCVNCGITYAAGYLTVRGLVNCGTLTYSAVITNNTTTSISGYYRIYADVNGDGIFTPAIDTLIRDTTAFSVGAGIGTTATVSGSVPTANLNQNLFLLLTQTIGPAPQATVVITLLSAQCSPLPITLRSFTANRTNRSNVSLKWETVTEINNHGFAIQRNTGGNNWQMVGFVNSQAPDGNSNATLSYTYNDINSASGITQYRLQQVDIDGKSKLSDIRAVRGEGQNGRIIVYPNPSTDGRVNVVFEDRESIRDASLVDMSGRILRQWKGLSYNTIQIDNLLPGIYSLRVIDRETAEQTVVKIAVNNR